MDWDEVKLIVPVGRRTQVSAIGSLPTVYPAGEGVGIVLAHGAGNDMHNPLLSDFARGLARAGYPTLRFNFPYREKGRKAPDRPGVLGATWQAVFEAFRNHERLRCRHVMVAGKSMGGRVGSALVADRALPAAGLVFLGYPLHPPGRQKELRDQHLYEIDVPMLFFAGTRDRLCDMGLLQGVLGKLQAPWTLETVEGGDHSFVVPKSMGVSQEEVHARVVSRTVEWLKRTEPTLTSPGS